MSIKQHFRPLSEDKLRPPLPSPPSTDPEAKYDVQLASTSNFQLTTAKKRKWSDLEDSTLLRLAMLRQVAPQRTDISWERITKEITSLDRDWQGLTLGRVRSRFFTLMHGAAQRHKLGLGQIAQNFALDRNASEIISHTQINICRPIADMQYAHETNYRSKPKAFQRLDQAKKKARLKEAAQVRTFNRPDVVAQRRAAANLTLSQCETLELGAGTIDQRLTQVPILTNPVPLQAVHAPAAPSSQCQQPQAIRSTYSSQISNGNDSLLSQLSSQGLQATHQLQAELKSQLRKEAYQYDAHLRKVYEKKFTEEQRRGKAEQIYLSAIEYKAKNQRPEKIYVRQKPVKIGTPATRSEEVRLSPGRKASKNKIGGSGERGKRGSNKKKSKRSKAKQNMPMSVTRRVQNAAMFDKGSEEYLRFKQLKERLDKKHKLGKVKSSACR